VLWIDLPVVTVLVAVTLAVAGVLLFSGIGVLVALGAGVLVLPGSGVLRLDVGITSRWPGKIVSESDRLFARTMALAETP